MPQLLLEILTEEIPARMQARAEADLQRLVMDAFTAAGVLPEAMRSFSGPRRLVLVADGLPVRSADVREERKGPRVGSPEGAIQGFLKSAGIASLEEARVVEDAKKGSFYVADILRPGRETVEVIATAVTGAIRAFPWPKSMRWGPNALSVSGDTRWVRPIQRILCTFDGELVPFEVDGLHSGTLTEGHRVMGRGPFAVRRFEDYEATLRTRGHVILDRDERKASLLADARTLCQARNLELVEDEGLANEVAGLVEYPVAILGDMERSFLDLPPEVIRLSMRTHQKYFAVRDPATGDLAPHFVTIANLKARDGGAKIAAGNARVLSARLSDARHFWDLDRKLPLDAPARIEKLKALVFHEKLGSVWHKVERVAALAKTLAPKVGADPELAHRAAMLSKMDLVTEMVGEFPELQGVMGRYYALGVGEHQDVADAIRDHYKPQGPSDGLPAGPVGLAVALADKLDTLVGFWAIGEKPTGSGDPYALRRAALGVIRMLVEGGSPAASEAKVAPSPPTPLPRERGDSLLPGEKAQGMRGHSVELLPALKHAAKGYAPQSATLPDLLAFFHDRLKVWLREQGFAHDIVAAAMAPGADGVLDDDLARVVGEVRALDGFLKTEDGRNLLAGYRRGVNILKAEEKKDPALADTLRATPFDPGLSAAPEEQALAKAMDKAEKAVAKALKADDFEAAMAALASLRVAVDAFFEKVIVNADDGKIRLNRLALLTRVRTALQTVADFAGIEG